MPSPPSSPSNKGSGNNSASNRQSSAAGNSTSGSSGQQPLPPALQRSSTVVGLQSKPSFISTLRTLPTQRQSIVGGGDAASGGAPPSSRGDPLSTNGPQSSLTFDDPPLSMRGPISTGPVSTRQNNMMSPSSGKAGSFPTSDDPMLPQSSSRVFDDTALDGSNASPKHPRTSTSASSRTPPLGEPAAVPMLAPTLLRTATWKLFFMDVAKLPEGTAEAYDQVFEENDMPPPTQYEVLQHGIDHEVLMALGIRSVGQRTRIIAACRNQAQSMVRSMGGDGNRVLPYGRGQSSQHHVHFDQSPRQYHPSGGTNGATSGTNHHTPMFPKIYRADFEGGDDDETTQQRFMREEQDSETGIGDIGEHVTSIGGSFGSEAHSSGHVNQGVMAKKPSSSLHEPLIRRESHVANNADVNKRGSVNVDGDDYVSSSSTPSPTFPTAMVMDENRVHEFTYQSNGRHGYTWVDLVGRDPKRLAFRDHLKHIVKTHHFAEQLLLDIDLTLALPQMISCPNEPDQFLIILRVAAESSGGIEEDSLHLLTNRIMIAVHMGTNTIVTIHRRDSMQMTALRECWYTTFRDKPMSALLCRVLDDGLLSYVDAIHDSESLLDEYEALMLKHSVGGSKASSSAGGSSTSFAMRQSFAPNASFGSEESAPWWSAKNICEKMFGGEIRDGASTRNRSSTVFHNQQQTATRLRNKEYQEEMMGSSTFSRQRMNQLLYHLHRRCSVYNRMLTLTQTTLEVSYATLHLASADYAEQVGRSCGELAMKAETLHDNCQNLLNLHLSLVSFRTNELMNLLTVYSAIFIPITFVCSVYGMNFDNMPELRLYYGYYYCWGGMLLIVFGIISWFRKKGFL